MPTNLSQSRYNKRGVSSDKSEVHKVVDHMDRGLFPGAFCKVTEDLLTNNPEYCNVSIRTEQARNPFWATCGIGRPATQAFSAGLPKTA